MVHPIDLGMPVYEPVLGFGSVWIQAHGIEADGTLTHIPIASLEGTTRGQGCARKKVST